MWTKAGNMHHEKNRSERFKLLQRRGKNAKLKSRNSATTLVNIVHEASDSEAPQGNCQEIYQIMRNNRSFNKQILFERAIQTSANKVGAGVNEKRKGLARGGDGKRLTNTSRSGSKQLIGEQSIGRSRDRARANYTLPE